MQVCLFMIFETENELFGVTARFPIAANRKHIKIFPLYMRLSLLNFRFQPFSSKTQHTVLFNMGGCLTR